MKNSELQAAVKWVARRSLPPGQPIISSYLGLKDGEIWGTDLDGWYSAKIEPGFKGGLAVPARPFEKLLRTMPKEITIEFDEWAVIIDGPTFRARLEGLGLDLIEPMPPIPENATSAVVDVDALQRALAEIEFAAAKDGEHAVVHMKAEQGDPGYLSFLATNTFRLSRAQIRAKVSSPWQAVISRSVAQQIMSAPTAGECTIFCGTDWLYFQTETAAIATKPEDRPILDWDHEPPQDACAIVDRKEFMDALRAAAVLAAEDAMRGTFTIADNKIVIEVCGGDLVNNISQFEVKAQTEGEAKAAFNVQYLADPLAKVKSEMVCLRFNNEPRVPGLLEPLPTTSKHWVMPMAKGGA
jgi:DNA polymerase III sliding clamp (beta) subunit (PCNA family)